MLRAALLDVGGTLWPNVLPTFREPDPRQASLRLVLPGFDAAEALEVLTAALREENRIAQDTHAAIAAALRQMGANDADAVAVRRALCVPASAGLQMFPGTANLLVRLRALGLRTVIVSDVQTRGATEYLADFAYFEVGHLLDAVVTSLDVGYRKPHHAVFEAAVREAGCEPAECVMVGNSERSDIEPAKALGLRAIRVAIEEQRPHTSGADAIATSLEDVSDVITRWFVGG